MNDVEKYQFDLNGYLVVKGALDSASVARCLAVADALEDRISSTIDAEPHFVGQSGLRFHYDEELGCSSYRTNHGGGGLQYVVDDFLNADPAFDIFVDHASIMPYVRELVLHPIAINSSELRYRHKGNITGTHMGGPIDSRNQYHFVGRQLYDAQDRELRTRDFDLLTLRVLYALHDLPAENGPLCVVPGTHKSNFHPPYGPDPMKEPGMIPVPMEAGDALLFTENLRHGGYPNTLERTRKTVHMCYAPAWVGSQSPAHWNGLVHVTEAAWARYSESQRALLPVPAPVEGGRSRISDVATQAQNRLREEIAELTKKNAELERELRAARGPILGSIADVIARAFR